MPHSEADLVRLTMQCGVDMYGTARYALVQHGTYINSMYRLYGRYSIVFTDRAAEYAQIVRYVHT